MPKFVNISNHPSAKWGEAQKKAAENFLELDFKIVDISFPNIDPEMKNIDNIVKDFFDNNILDNYFAGDVIHIMGESGFVFQFVNFLHKKGFIHVVHSTTKRVAVVKEDGTKESKFEFCKFRYY